MKNKKWLSLASAISTQAGVHILTGNMIVGLTAYLAVYFALLALTWEMD